jgi:hypothetical protein
MRFARKRLSLILWLAVLVMPVAAVAMPAPESVWRPEATETGWLSAYAPHVMDWQVEYRIGTGQAPEHAFDYYETFIAVADCSLIGDVWILRPVDAAAGRAGEWREALIVDCAGSAHTVAWMTGNHILAELDYETWVDWQGYRNEDGLGVEVVKVTEKWLVN